MRLELNAGIPVSGEPPTDYVTAIRIHSIADDGTRTYVGWVELTAEQAVALLQPRNPITVEVKT